MIGDCTILVPTHNRHHYLDRCIGWFLQFGCPIVVADSSSSEWNSDLRGKPSVRYLHKPAVAFERYCEKMYEALDRVETPLVAICADDDLIAESGLHDSVQFLRAHPDYSFSQGYAYTFQEIGGRLVLTPMPYGSHDIVSESWIERVELARSTVFYGVNRTDLLKRAFDFLRQQDFREIPYASAGFIDFCITALAAKGGKFKRCPVPFGFREYSPVVSAVGTRHRTIVSRNVPDLYANLLAVLAGPDASDDVQDRLLKLMARDYAGQIAYDATIQSSKKETMARVIPAPWLDRVEYAYRLYSASRSYASKSYYKFSGVFFSPEYRRVRDHILRRVEG